MNTIEENELRDLIYNLRNDSWNNEELNMKKIIEFVDNLCDNNFYSKVNKRILYEYDLYSTCVCSLMDKVEDYDEFKDAKNFQEHWNILEKMVVDNHNELNQIKDRISRICNYLHESHCDDTFYIIIHLLNGGTVEEYEDGEIRE